MLEQDLEKLGLDKREAGVYVTLLRLGEAPATELIHRLSWHRQLIYNALDRLKQLGLVTTVARGVKQRFRPSPPHKLLEQQRAQVDLATALVPKLEAVQPAKLEQFIEVHPGFDGVRYVHEDILHTLKRGGTVCTLGASGTDYGRVMGDYHDDWTRRRQKREITLRALSFRSEAASINTLFRPDEPFTELRYLVAQYETPTSTKIYADKIIIQIWGPAEPVMILIQNAAVANNYQNYFDFLWKLAGSKK